MARPRLPAGMIAIFAAAVLPAPAYATITLMNGFSVKNTFTGSTFGLPSDLGGLSFSSDGSTLYVVGAVDRTTSAVYALGVTRDANNLYVTGLVGPACQVFGSTVTLMDVGIDAGLQFAPSGTLFYSYFDANLLAQRVGTFGCAQPPTSSEMKFNMGTMVQLESSVAGLTFSPFRADPSTGFGRLQVNTGYHQNVYEILLSAPSGGFYAPSSKTVFVTLPTGSLGNMQYVPSAPLEGNLMYVAYDAGELHVVSIDRPTGLAIDKTTGMPTLGTANPMDTTFASGFGSDLSAGPFGLTFDLRSGDLFVTTSQGIPSNSIIQIGDFAVPTTTTTTSTTTTTTTSTTSSTTTTIKCGDVNGDGVIDIGDALVVAQYDVGVRVCGLSPFSDPMVCDVNGDAACNIGDALKIAQCDVGTVSCEFSCGSFSCP